MTNDLSDEIAKTGWNEGVAPATAAPVAAAPAPYIQRMTEELAQLSDRHMKLNMFFSNENFAQLNPIDQQLMREQYDYMGAYLTVLKARLDRARQ